MLIYDYQVIDGLGIIYHKNLTDLVLLIEPIGQAEMLYE